MSAVGIAHGNAASSARRFSGIGHVAVAAAALAAFGGLACWLGLRAAAVPSGAIEAALCAGPALVTAAMGLTSQTDRNAYTGRVLIPALMLPILLMMWAISQQLQLSQGGLIAAVFGFIVLHGLGFAALIFVLASSTTRIEAEPDTAPVDAATLSARLQSLLAGDLPWTLSAGDAPHAWALDSRVPDEDKRFHRVLLDIDETRREVQVRERLGADGAKPRDAEEAGMRSGGDDAFDGSRPDAQKVWSRTFQTTMIRPERLAAVRLHLMGRHAQAEAKVTAKAADGEAMLTLLAALVTRSGYAWQPVMAQRS